MTSPIGLSSRPSSADRAQLAALLAQLDAERWSPTSIVHAARVLLDLDPDDLNPIIPAKLLGLFP